MSEFKVGDLVKMKDDSSTWMDKVAAIEYKPCFDSKWNRYEIEILVFEDGTKLGSGWAIHVVKAAGHRIDKPIVKSRFSFTSEQAKRIGDRQIERYMKEAETLGDDSHIENHISLLCKSKDV